MPTEIVTALTSGLTSLKDVFIAGVLLAIPVGFSIWAVKIGIKVAPSMVKGFIRK